MISSGQTKVSVFLAMYADSDGTVRELHRLYDVSDRHFWKTVGVGRQPGTRIDGQSRDVRGEACGSAESVSALQAFLPAWRLSLQLYALRSCCSAVRWSSVCVRRRCAVHASYSLVFVRDRFVCVWEKKKLAKFLYVSVHLLLFMWHGSLCLHICVCLPCSERENMSEWWR